MADKNDVESWDTDAADNTDIAGIPLDEGATYPSHVNNAFRAVMAQIATFINGWLGREIHSSPAKTAPAGADEFGFWDSVSGLARKLSFTNLVDAFAQPLTLTPVQQAQMRTNIGLNLGYPLLHVQEQTSSGTPAGLSVVGQQSRNLNTVLVNEIAGSSLSEGAAFLPEGTYHVCGFVTGYWTNRHRAALIRVTDGAVQIRSRSGYSAATGNDQADALPLEGRLVVPSGGRYYRLWHNIETAKFTDGLGVQSASPYGAEVYSELMFWELK